MSNCQWDILGPKDFRKDVPTIINSSDEGEGGDNSTAHHQPSPNSSVPLLREALSSVSRKRRERSTSSNDRHPRYKSQRQQPPLSERDKPTVPALASSSQDSLSRSSQQNISTYYLPPYRQIAQSLQAVTRLPPSPMWSFANKPTRTATTVLRGDDHDDGVHAFVPAPLAGCGVVASRLAAAHSVPDRSPSLASEPTTSTERARNIALTLLPAGPTSMPVPQSSSGGTSARTPKRFAICTDLQLDKDSRTIIALMEIPGVTKSDIKISLDTCKFSGVRLLLVTGLSRPEDGTWALQERKYGQFGRTILVPPKTKPDDIVAELKNGVLRVKVHVRSQLTGIDNYPIYIPIMD